MYDVNSKPPTDGLEAAGWRLVYNGTPNNKPFNGDFPNSPTYYASYSIGIDIKKDGTISDVMPGSPAYEAGLGPQMTIVAVDGRVYSADVLNEAIEHPRNGMIALIVRALTPSDPVRFDTQAGYGILIWNESPEPTTTSAKYWSPEAKNRVNH